MLRVLFQPDSLLGHLSDSHADAKECYGGVCIQLMDRFVNEGIPQHLQLQVISSSLHAPFSFNIETHGEATLDLLEFPFVDVVVRLGVHFRIAIFPCHNVFWEVSS